MATQRALALLLNTPAAGDDRLREAVHQLRDRGHRIEVRPLWEPGQARQIAAELAEQHTFDVLVAAGGDGTLNEVINGVMAATPHSPPAVGLLPYGTANDFAKTARVPDDDPAAALRIAAYVEPTPLDLGQANQHWFINAATFGIAAETTAETAKPLKHLLGGAAYSLNAIAKLTDTGHRPARVTAPATADSPALNWQGDLLMLTVANAPTAGGGYSIAPDALLDDGLLDVTLIANAPAGELAELLAKRITASRLSHPAIIQRRVSELTIKAEQPLALNIDGESQRVQHCHIQVHRQAIPVLMGS